MKIKFLGHASFLITSAKGIRIITDPYKTGCFDGGIRYAPITEEADIVTISHEHDDHNETNIPGNPTFVRGAVKKDIQGIAITGISTYHDESAGKERGTNTIFSFIIDGIHCVHLGDLGHTLTPADVKKIGSVDLLLVPIGGYFTIDATHAEKIITTLKPKIIIPMHFKTDKCGFPIASVETFIKGKHAVRATGEIEITKDKLPAASTIYVLNPTK